MLLLCTSSRLNFKVLNIKDPLINTKCPTVGEQGHIADSLHLRLSTKEPHHPLNIRFYQHVEHLQVQLYLHVLTGLDQSYLSISNLWSHQAVAYSDHDYLEALTTLQAKTVRAPADRETTFAVCSGVAAGPLSCRVCLGSGNTSASQIFWEKDV